MNKIRKLSSEVVSRIAAGEVVERPMNIVKELVENSLDAQADRIFVTIADGGKDLIQVQDNGEGIATDDLDIAFQLHTTSKLDDGDPSIVSTLGFRGEALASIAAVSRIDVQSKAISDENGRKLVLEGGKILQDNQITAKTGTMIKVSGIFFNTPARRKFLKTASTERKRIADLLTNYCLMYPEVHFKLVEKLNSGTTVRIESPSRKSIMAVIYDVLGAEYANDLIALEETIGDWELEGYISKPSLSRADRAFQFINVNGRPIRNKDLQSAIEDAYGSQLMRRTHPILILKIQGPVDAVDFNIHPQKSEIRFKENDQIFAELPHVVLETLSSEVDLPAIQQNKLDRLRNKHHKKTERSQSISKSPSASSQQKKEQQSPDTESSRTEKSQHGSSFRIPTKSPNTYQTSLDNQKITEQTGRYDVLGHVMNKFGLVFANNELWLVDVHAADERVKFEMYAQGKEREVSSQTLLQALPIDLPESDKQILFDNANNLKQFGLKISNGGNNQLLIHSVPVYYDQNINPQSIKDLLNDIISHLNDDDAETGPSKTPLDNMEYTIISRLACHGAIRSGYPVSKERIKQVLDDLMRCEYPWTCAHGRPTVLRLPKSRIESFFSR